MINQKIKALEQELQDKDVELKALKEKLESKEEDDLDVRMKKQEEQVCNARAEAFEKGLAEGHRRE